MHRPVTLVTGASRGIGLAIANRLAGEGHHVIGLSRTPPPAGSPCEHVSADLADISSTGKALEAILRRQPVDNLVNNAGIQIADRAGEVSLAAFEQTLAINARAVLQCMQACLPAMRARRAGRIVNIGSRAALGRTERSAYGFSKAGLVALSRTWALELGRDGITVNVVAPGPVVTELFLVGKSEEQIDRLARSAPLGRLGRPEDVAGAVSFLLGPDAGYITGQVLHVCGGMSIGLMPV